MKKVLSVILVISCMFALLSCDLFGGVTADFTKAIKNTEPSRAVIDIVSKTDLGDLNSSYEIIYNEDGSATINYSYERFNKIGEGDGEIKSTFTGTVTRNADGTYNGTDVDVSSVSDPAKLDLSAINEENLSVNEAGDVLTATVSADETEAVFGTAFAENIDLELTIADGQVSRVSLIFESGSIDCKYE